MKEILRLLRVKQYIKNLFIFLPAFFAFKFLDLYVLEKNFISFISFCLISSSIYILNDIIDRESDKKHPLKKLRPIASGKISLTKALLILLLLFSLGLSLIIIFFDFSVLIFFLIYIVINILYTFWIKHVGIVDVFFIAIGFVLRILIGGASATIQINSWIVIMTFLLALFLGFAKRRDDLLLAIKSGASIRKSIDGYNLKFVDSVLVISSSVTLVSYLMYTLSEQTIKMYNSNYIFITSIFVLLGILRYLQLSIILEKSGSPTETLYQDKIIQFSILGWIITYFIILYF